MAESMKEFTDGNWKLEVLESPIPVVVDFWAPWCPPCRALTPTIEKLAADYAGKVKVGKLNCDENQETPGSLRILSIPTILFFKNGKEVDRLGWAQRREQVESVAKREVRRCLKTDGPRWPAGDRRESRAEFRVRGIPWSA